MGYGESISRLDCFAEPPMPIKYKAKMVPHSQLGCGGQIITNAAWSEEGNLRVIHTKMPTAASNVNNNVAVIVNLMVGRRPPSETSVHMKCGPTSGSGIKEQKKCIIVNQPLSQSLQNSCKWNGVDLSNLRVVTFGYCLTFKLRKSLHILPDLNVTCVRRVRIHMVRETDAAPVLNTELWACLSGQFGSGNVRVRLGKELVRREVAKVYEMMWLKRDEASKLLLMWTFPYIFNNTTDLSPRSLLSIFENGQFESLHRLHISADGIIQLNIRYSRALSLNIPVGFSPSAISSVLFNPIK